MRRIFSVLLVLAASSSARSDGDDRLNVLFIAVDDLRPELGCTGHPVVKSPRIDRLAREGLLFDRAYCQQAVCNPSRASLMTGLRPETIQVTDLPTHFRDRKPDAVSIPQHFKAHGYVAERIGKIYHTGHGNRDDKFSWTVMRKHKLAPRYGPGGTKHLKDLWAEARKKGLDLKQRKNQPRGLPWEAPEVEDDALRDGSIAAGAIRVMNEIKDRPFFLAVGFLNPHLPFVSPRKYWDLYPPNVIKLATNPEPPKDAPRFARTNWGELRRYHGIPDKGPLSEAQARKMVHGYWAAVSYIDAQVGRLLDELDRLDLRKKTVVVLWGDHGWYLGEHGMWCKHTNYEYAARAPLIFSVPNQPNAGRRTRALTEFVDIFPSLVDACGLPMPDGLEGISFTPLLENPDRPWKTAAFNLYPRSIRGQGRGMGRAIRTGRYRLVEWTVPGKSFVERELYDHEKDPQENVNVAAHPEYADTVKELSEKLRAGWRAALPRE